MRGQDRLLIGNNTSKVDKKLEIPPAIARKPRPVDILKVQEPRASDLVSGAFDPFIVVYCIIILRMSILIVRFLYRAVLRENRLYSCCGSFD